MACLRGWLRPSRSHGSGAGHSGAYVQARPGRDAPRMSHHPRVPLNPHQASNVELTAEVVRPALRGGFGRDYHYASEAPTTQRMLPEGAGHGAVALAEHQSEGRGRLG